MRACAHLLIRSAKADGWWRQTPQRNLTKGLASETASWAFACNCLHALQEHVQQSRRGQSGSIVWLGERFFTSLSTLLTSDNGDEPPESVEVIAT